MSSELINVCAIQNPGDHGCGKTTLIFKLKKPFGNDLLSQGVAPQVPSAQTALTTGFEMWPGVPPSL
jgi:hypothetical protein